MAGLRFTIAGECCTMVLLRYKSMHPFLKVVRHGFVILDGCCTLHRRCCTLWISIFRRAITLGSFRVTGAITSQNEGICEFYSYDSFQPSLVSFIPKKSYPNLNRVMEVFYPSFFRHVDFFCKAGSPWLVNDLPSLENGAPWYCTISNPCIHF